MNDRSTKTAAFWAWFSENAPTLATHLNASESRELDRLLSPRVASLGKSLRWEVGPGLSTEYGFSLSPNHNREMLRLTDAIVAAAPSVNGWEFHSGKPPKRWDMRFHVGGVPVDARSWQYLLTSYNNREFYDVTLVAENLPPLTGGQHELAGYLLLEGVLGERLVLERIGRIELVRDAPQSINRLSSIAVLAEHLRHLQQSESR